MTMYIEQSNDSMVLMTMCINSLMTQWFFHRGVGEQTTAFMKGFNEVIPLEWLQYFDEREFEVCVSCVSCPRLCCPRHILIHRSSSSRQNWSPLVVWLMAPMPTQHAIPTVSVTVIYRLSQL